MRQVELANLRFLRNETTCVAETVGTCSLSPPTVMHLRLLGLMKMEEAKHFVSARCPRP